MNNKFLLSLVLLFFTSGVIAQSKTDIPISRKLQMSEFLINKLYVDSLDEGKLVEAGIQGMLNVLDPHSTYSTPEEVKEFKASIEGGFEGIGVQYQMIQDTLYVIRTIPKGPSEKAGILAGDRVVAVNDTVIAGVNFSTSKIMKLLRGPRKSTVDLTVVRKGHKDSPLVLTVKRDRIPVESIDASYLISDDIGYIRINQFGKNTDKEFIAHLKTLKKEGMKSLILDLRGNSGGFLEIAVEISNQFLDAKQQIVSARGESVNIGGFMAKGNGLFKQGKLVVLIDEYSASASEIVAGAVQDWDRGVIVGRRSFGKGLVQRPIDLFDGSMIRLTVARYYTPSGRSIQKPYAKGADKRKKYRMDIINRIEKGEMVSQDSIQLVDSLKYTTSVAKRPVYGGGGIMPDCFVPVDTNSVNNYFYSLLQDGLMMEIAVKYVEDEGEQIKRDFPSSNEFVANYEVSELLLNAIEMSSLAQEATENDRLISRPYISHYLKALMARDIWSMSAFYQVYNQKDPIVQKGIEVLNSSIYEQVLQPTF